MALIDGLLAKGMPHPLALLLSQGVQPVAAPLTTLSDNGILTLTDGVTAPAAVVGKAFIFVDAADGDLKVRFGDGITKTLATDT